MPYTYEELSDRLEKLPEDLKDAIFSTQSSQTILEIAKKYALHVDKVGELVNETGLVMVGLTHPKDFINNLSERLEIDQTTARKIAEDINNQIFSRVRESLKKIHGISEPETTPPKPETPTTKPETRSSKSEQVPPASPSEAGRANSKIQDSALRPLEINPLPAAGLEIKKLELPKVIAPEPAKPTEPAAKTIPPKGVPTMPIMPGAAFEEKTKEAVFRTPAELHEKTEEKTATAPAAPKTPEKKSFLEIKQEIKSANAAKPQINIPTNKLDPYREPIE